MLTIPDTFTVNQAARLYTSVGLVSPEWAVSLQARTRGGQAVPIHVLQESLAHIWGRYIFVHEVTNLITRHVSLTTQELVSDLTEVAQFYILTGFMPCPLPTPSSRPDHIYLLVGSWEDREVTAYPTCEEAVAARDADGCARRNAEATRLGLPVDLPLGDPALIVGEHKDMHLDQIRPTFEKWSTLTLLEVPMRTVIILGARRC